MVISETEILEEEEEPKEAEAGSQTDVPIVEVQYNIAVHPTPSLEAEMATYSSVLLGKFHGQRAWWGHRESNTTEPIYINVPCGGESSKRHEIHCHVKYKRILLYYLYIF